MRKYNFVTPSLEREISVNALDKTFPMLKTEHKTELLKYVIDIIDVIAIKFNFKMGEETRRKYERQLKQNDYRDTKGLLLLLLPYIDDPTGASKERIKSLDEIYKERKKSDKKKNINECEPKYKYSNIQYGRCVRQRKGGNKEREFEMLHVKQNYILLKQTIQIVANKLYVNWLDVRPMDIKTIYETELYKKTWEVFINKRKLPRWNPAQDEEKEPRNEEGREYGGLYVGDIYNVIANNMFHQIKNVKWLLYDTTGEESYPYVIVIGEILPINKSLNGYNWNQLTDEEKTYFKVRWSELKRASNENISIGSVGAQDSKRILKSVMIFFNKYYDGRSEAINKGEYIPFKLPDGAEEEGKEIDVEHGVLYESIHSLDPKHMYMYIKQSLVEFSPTWYAKQVRVYDEKKREYKIVSVGEYERHIQEIQEELKKNLMEVMKKEEAEEEIESAMRVTLKNVYNFAKSLTHYTISKKGEKETIYLEYPKYWRSLSKRDKNEIRNRLCMRLRRTEDGYNEEDTRRLMDWFNLSRYFLKQYEDVRELEMKIRTENLKNMHAELYEQIIDKILKIIFSVLITDGTLSNFEPTAKLTDAKELPADYMERTKKLKKRMKAMIFNKENKETRWKGAYNFLTGEQYDYMEKIRIKKKGKMKEYDYYEHVSRTGYSWAPLYAMDWISQIGFFHRYIHGRVLLVTGSTGVGKTSQVPKLLLYALKMIDYKYDGKIVHTTPRISATMSPAKTISMQLGVPIEEYNEALKEMIRTKNYYVQFKHSERAHTSDEGHLYLRLMTDGTLYMEMKMNPILKKKQKQGYEVMYTDKNVYDIVIVDEAHEHNKNMDLILSMMKYALYYNNKIKLVIISATMEEDEPRYRRYYRDINDNKLYPFDQILETEELDRVNVDRRIHISAPGQSTLYVIEDIEEPKKESDEVVLEITRKIRKGDILYFQPGVREITKSLEYLNKKMPPNVIAIPYHGQMQDYKRTFIEELTNNSRKEIVIPRHVNYGEKYDESKIKKKPRGTYEHVVIIATNVAEASITINTLKYVVDTGNQKTNYYDYSVRFPKLKLVSISESSRMQRRGRVGRVGSGMVYYMYEKKRIENNKTQYNISIEDIKDSIFDLLRESSEEERLFENDPNEMEELNRKQAREIFKDGTHDMVINGYFNKDKIIAYKGNKTQYDYEKSMAPEVYYKTGYETSTLLDTKGSFYIVHPDELEILRNIAGEIIGVTDEEKLEYKEGEAKSHKIEEFIKILLEQQLIMKKKETYNKTKYGIGLNMIKEKIEIEDMRYVISYLYGRKYNQGEEIFKLSSLVERNRDGVKSLLYGYYDDYGRYRKPIEKAVSLYGNEYGDVIGILKIIEELLDYINEKIVNINMKPGKIPNDLRKQIGKEKQKYLKGKVKREYEGITLGILDKLIDMDSNNKLSNVEEITEEEAEEYVKNDLILEYVKKKIEEKKEDIEIWCRNKSLDAATMMRYVINYVKAKNNLDKYEKKLYEIDYDDIDKNVELLWYDKNISVLEINEHREINIINSLLRGFGYNIAKKMEGVPLYMGINEPKPNKIYGIKRLNKKTKIKDTLLKGIERTDYLLYLNRDEEDIFLVQRINPRMIQTNVAHRYVPEMYLPENYNLEQNREIINIILKSISVSKTRTKIAISSSLINNYLETLQKIRNDMLSNYDSLIWNTLIKLDDGDEYKKNLMKEKKRQQDILNIIKNQYGGRLNIIKNKYKESLKIMRRGETTKEYDYMNLINRYIRYIVRIMYT